MANIERVKEIFEQTQAIITGSHIVYTSRLHGEAYVNKDAVYPHTRETSELCAMIASNFQNQDIDVVIGPEKGGIILAQWTAFHLSQLTRRDVLAIYAEKGPNETFVFNRGYDRFIPNRRLLVVEDVLTTGGSVKKVLEALKPFGGDVVGVGVLCNRGGVRPEDIGGVDIDALISVSMTSWPASECPLCESRVPVNTDVGKGKEFLDSYKFL